MNVSGSPSPAASTPRWRSRGCARRGRCPTPTPPTSASTTSPTSASVPGRAGAYGAEGARLVDCKAALVEEGLAALDLRRVPHQVGRPRLLQHHAAGPRGHRHAAGAGHAGRRGADLGRRLHLQGQRHRAVLPLRPARQPARCGSTSRGWTPPSSASWAAGRRCRSGWPTASCPTGQARRRPTPPTRTSGAPPTRPSARAPRRQRRDRRARSWACGSGTPTSRSPAEDVTVTFERGRPVADQRQGVRHARSTWCSRPTRSADGTGSACPTRSRTGSSRPSRAASTRRRAWRCCTSPTSAWSARSTTRTPSPPTTTRAASSAGCCTRAAGSTRSR